MKMPLKLSLLAGAMIGIALTTTVAASDLLGAGSTFAYPLFSKMFSEYGKNPDGAPVNYQSIGSGGGIRQLLNKTVDFGATDAFLSDPELKAFKTPVVHIPIMVGAVVMTYNLPGNPQIRLTPELIAGIFKGTISKWNDPKIKAVNPSVVLPALTISVVHRSDGSGTTYVFTDYLSNVDATWKAKVGTGKSVAWPVGLGAKGNEGVAGMVKQLPGSFGYVELVYALQSKMAIASLRNKSGTFVKANLDSVSVAAEVTIPSDTRISLTNTDAKNGYPISGFTWVLVYKEQIYGNRTLAKAQQTKKLLSWMVSDGQKYTAPLQYAPLSKKVRLLAAKNVESLTFDGKPIR